MKFVHRNAGLKEKQKKAEDTCPWCRRNITDGTGKERRYSDGVTSYMNARVHTECAQEIDVWQAELEAENKKRSQQAREHIEKMPASFVVSGKHQVYPKQAEPTGHMLQDAGYDWEDVLNIKSRKTERKLRESQKALKQSGFDEDITFRDFWENASPELTYAQAQGEALAAHQEQLRRLKTITYAKQVQVAFLKMPYDLAVLFARALTSDPGGKIAKLFQLEANLKARKALPGAAPKRLTVGKKAA